MADPSSQSTGGHPIADRRTKLQRLRCELDIDPYGRRVDGLIDLTAARSLFDHAKEADERSAAAIAGRVVLNRNIGKLIFMTLRDHTGDLQIALSKKAVDELSFKLARLTDLGDIVVARGRIGKTKTGEITLWVMALDQEASYEIACKSLAPPPEKWKGLVDPELRYRRRYVDMYVDPQVMTTFRQRSRIIKATRDFLADPPEPLGPGFIEVETPMMQPVAGGAAARPFTTHHNALDMDLFMRIAPELYLKRLLVGGMGRVFEINRNFRNEGIDRKHNPEFTMLELYQAFGDYQTMMQLTEMLIHTLAVKVCDAVKLPFDDLEIDYALPFTRATYHDLFEQHNGFAAGDHTRLVEKAGSLGIAPQDKAHDVLLNEVWEATVEQHLIQPTFVMDYPASLCPLTRQKVGRPDIAERFELFIASMELANAYSELNDPDVQQANFQQQEADLDEKQATFRTMDHDFIESLKVGMPPAGGLGIGIDRLVMLLTNHRSIRDVILFPLLRPATGG